MGVSEERARSDSVARKVSVWVWVRRGRVWYLVVMARDSVGVVSLRRYA